jgi:hypothetical protein
VEELNKSAGIKATAQNFQARRSPGASPTSAMTSPGHKPPSLSINVCSPDLEGSAMTPSTYSPSPSSRPGKLSFGMPSALMTGGDVAGGGDGSANETGELRLAS